MEITLELILAVVVAIIAVVGLARSNGRDLNAWGLLLLAAIHIIPLFA